MVAQGMGHWRGGGEMPKGCGASFQGDGNVLKVIVLMVTQLCDSTKSSQAVHFKWACCGVWELYLNKAIKKSPSWQSTHSNQRPQRPDVLDTQIILTHSPPVRNRMIFSHYHGRTISILLDLCFFFLFLINKLIFQSF